VTRRLLVVRHGRTEWNATDRFQGQADIPLDEVGRAQAAAMAAVVAAERPSVIWSSDLGRARETAAALAALTAVEVQVEPAFREIFTGDWEGLTGAEVRARWPADWTRWQRGEDIQRAGGAETRGEVGRRFGAALVPVADAIPDGGCAVVVGHGTAMRAGMAHFVGYPDGSEWLFGSVRNCHWLRLTTGVTAVSGPDQPTGRGWRVDGYNIGAGQG